MGYEIVCVGIITTIQCIAAIDGIIVAKVNWNFNKFRFYKSPFYLYVIYDDTYKLTCTRVWGNISYPIKVFRDYTEISTNFRETVPSL